MTSNDEIIELCHSSSPSLIYFAIGCAYGSDSPQQYPPFLSEIKGRHICILMDPMLESPPVIYKERGMQNNLTFIEVRRRFDWRSATDTDFIDRLCELCIYSQTRFIVQDYSGAVIHPFYPLKKFGRPLLGKVLFDFTYQDGGCFIDLEKVRLLMRPDGSFVQPLFERITDSHAWTPKAALESVLKARRDVLINYVKRFYRILKAQEEVRDWCTAAIVLEQMRHLCLIYGTRVATDSSALEDLMVAYLHDLCNCVGDFLEDPLIIVRPPTPEYEQALRLLEACIENPHPV